MWQVMHAEMLLYAAKKYEAGTQNSACEKRLNENQREENNKGGHRRQKWVERACANAPA